MAPADTWAELAPRFNAESVPYPDLRVFLIEYPEAWEVSSNPADEQARSDAAARWNRLRPAIKMAKFVAADSCFGRRKIRLLRHHLGREQVFYGKPARRDAPGWQRFVELAHNGVDLAFASGVIPPMPQPEQRWTAIETDHWLAWWMDLVYQLARKPGPGSHMFGVKEWRGWKGKLFPYGMRVVTLRFGVFISSAYAAGLLAGDAKAQQEKYIDLGRQKVGTPPRPDQPPVQRADPTPAEVTKAKQAPEAQPYYPADLVTLNQAAGMVHRSKRTLEVYKTEGRLPAPTVEGGGGRPDLWDWAVIRPWLTQTFGINLPESFPANRRNA
jgi:hypothetical protein